MHTSMEYAQAEQKAWPGVSALLTPFGLQRSFDGRVTNLTELPIPLLRSWTLTHGLVVLRGLAPLEEADLVAYAATWGEILTWNFGSVLNLLVHEAPQNYLFTRGNVPLHWDGAFARAVPSFQLFQCIKAPPPGAGGETLFSHTPTALRFATAAQRRLWESVHVTYQTEKLAHYGGRVTAALVSRHPGTGEPTLRFAEKLNDESVHLNPLEIEIEGVSVAEQPIFLEELRAALYDPRVCYAHAWRDGDFLVADNHALLHGRNAFRPESPRHLRRVHIL